MAELTPDEAEATERLHRYWVHGEGAAKIGWGQPNDFSRCVEHLSKYIHDAKGYCNLAHHAATGMWPAQHAAMEHGRASMADTQRAEMTSASINDLPDSDFAYIEPGGKKDSSGRTVPRDLRHFPVHDAAHVRDALSRAPQSPFGDKAMPKIRAAAKKFGVDVGDDDSGDGSSRAASLMPYTRAFPLEDVSVKTTRDGRIVDAYFAVFNTPAEVVDQDGKYTEDLDPALLNKAISDAAPQGSRRNWKVGVFYNHAMTIYGTPSERFSVPVAVTQNIAPDGRGVRATDKYHRSEFCDEIVEGLESGAIPGYSFQGRFLRSSPRVPRGGFKQNYRTGALPHVRRLESTLKEYGPTPFPVYADAKVLGLRSDSLMFAMMQDPELARRMLGMFQDGTPRIDEEPPPESGTPPNEEPPPRSRPAHSGRSIREQIQANTALLLQGQYRR